MSDNALAKAPATTATVSVDSATTTSAAGVKDTPISGAGWIFLTLAWTAILVTCIFCFARLFNTRKKLAAPLEIDTEGQ